jgi:hypothetical protein
MWALVFSHCTLHSGRKIGAKEALLPVKEHYTQSSEFWDTCTSEPFLFCPCFMRRLSKANECCRLDKSRGMSWRCRSSHTVKRSCMSKSVIRRSASGSGTLHPAHIQKVLHP